jgi:hypothetical protein
LVGDHSKRSGGGSTAPSASQKLAVIWQRWAWIDGIHRQFVRGISGSIFSRSWEQQDD